MSFNNILISYCEDMGDLIYSVPISSMKSFRQHGTVNCFSHSLLVSYLSYLLAFKFDLDYISAGRGALMHDMFLYDTKKDFSKMPKHLVTHAKVALFNAKENYVLNKKEENIIESHMWPLSDILPNTKEAVIVNLMDKLSMIIECLGLYRYVTKRIGGSDFKSKVYAKIFNV